MTIEVRIMCEKAPVMNDKRTEEFGNFVKKMVGRPVNFEFHFPSFCKGYCLK